MKKFVYRVDDTFRSMFQFKYLVIGLIGAIIGVGAMHMRSSQRMTAPEYTTSAKVMIVPTKTAQSKTPNPIDGTIINTYGQLLKSNQFIKDANKALKKQGIKVSNQNLNSMISTKNEDYTTIYTIKAKSNTNHVKKIANSVANTAKKEYTTWMGTTASHVKVIQSAKKGKIATQSTGSSKKALFIGLVLGFIVILIPFWIYLFMQKEVPNAAYLKRIFKINVLAKGTVEGINLSDAAVSLTTRNDLAKVLAVNSFVGADTKTLSDLLANQIAQLNKKVLIITAATSQEINDLDESINRISLLDQVNDEDNLNETKLTEIIEQNYKNYDFIMLVASNDDSQYNQRLISLTAEGVISMMEMKEIEKEQVVQYLMFLNQESIENFGTIAIEK